VVELRPANGGGSCARCQAALDLASVRSGDRWYCSPACAQGRPLGAGPDLLVAEARLYHRPRRFFGRRAPKELRRRARVAS
jgi:hypothetical protein